MRKRTWGAWGAKGAGPGPRARKTEIRCQPARERRTLPGYFRTCSCFLPFIFNAYTDQTLNLSIYPLNLSVVAFSFIRSWFLTSEPMLSARLYIFVVSHLNNKVIIIVLLISLGITSFFSTLRVFPWRLAVSRFYHFSDIDTVFTQSLTHAMILTVIRMYPPYRAVDEGQHST